MMSGIAVYELLAREFGYPFTSDQERAALLLSQK